MNFSSFSSRTCLPFPAFVIFPPLLESAEGDPTLIAGGSRRSVGEVRGRSMVNASREMGEVFGRSVTWEGAVTVGRETPPH